MRTAHRTCPICDAVCGLRLTLDGAGRVTSVKGDPDDPFSKGFVCPKGASLGRIDEDPDRLRVPMIRKGGEWREATWEEAFQAVDQVTRHPQRLLRQHHRPDTEAGGRRPHARRPDGHRGARSGPHRLPADPGGQPGGVQRLALRRPGLPRPPEGAARAGRQAGGRRPAPHQDRGLRRRAPVRTARHRRLPAARHRAHPPRRGSHEDRYRGERPGGAPAAGGGVHPAGRGAGVRGAGRGDRTAGPRAGRRPHGRRLLPHRHLHRRVRHRRAVAGRRAQYPDRQLRPPRRGHVHQDRRRRAFPHRAAVHGGKLAQPRPRAAGGARRAAGGHPRRRDRDAG